MIVQTLAAQAAAFLALLLIVSSLHKVRRWSDIRSATETLAGLPRALSGAATSCAIAVELLAGILLVRTTSRVPGAGLTLFVWGGYTGLLLRALAQGRRDVDCGCGFGGMRHDLGAFEVSRNLLLLGVTSFVAWSSATGGASAVVALQVLAAFALLALYGALDQVMALAPLRSGEVI